MKIQNNVGLTVEFLENGAVKSIESGPIRINLKPSSLFSDPGTNIFLRRRDNQLDFTALTGPGSRSRFQIAENTYIAAGSWSGIDYRCMLRLSQDEPGWQWRIELQNTTTGPLDLDLVYLQDIGLKSVNAGLLNEYYVSQYLERLILEDKNHGPVIACRQNMKEQAGFPRVILTCQNGANSACTDGMQFYGKTYRETGIPEGLMLGELGGEYAGESSVVALQSRPFVLNPGETCEKAFTGIYLSEYRGTLGTKSQGMASQCLPFSLSSFLPVSDLTTDELNSLFGQERRNEETIDGKLLSFFAGHNHIILKNKEILTDRPHAHIMQAQSGLVPDENILATTAFAFGVFNSHISQGNTNFNVLLSICTSQFNQTRESGQRIIIEINDEKYLLGIPSAFEMGLNHCRWIYKHKDIFFQVRTWTSKNAPQVNLDFRVIGREKERQGDKETGREMRRLWITHDFDPLNKWKIFQGVNENEYFALPEDDTMIKNKFKNARYRITVQGNTKFIAGGDELLFDDRKRHGSNLFVLEVGPTDHFCMSFTGEVCQPHDGIRISDVDSQFGKDCINAWSGWKKLSLDLDLISDHKDIAAIREILPWYGMNALIHYLTPYGLEQFGGAAWGTRDVSQGPVNLLLNLGKYAEARQVLLTIFSNQNADGGWPQWWMFDSYTNIRSDSSHDDIYYWCLISLASYIKVTGDLKILDELLPYYCVNDPESKEKTPLHEHADRLINMITSSFIPGTSLVPFGGGDWNDSLQPVSKELAERMISSWTVQMNYQAFSEYRKVFELSGDDEKAALLRTTCEKIKTDFNKYLVKDAVVAGYGLVETDGTISVMLHPSDNKTGIHFSLLPMERGVLSGIFSKEQALHHQELIKQHLQGPDGARLMDRPLKYKGGLQEIFQRAESSTFFGREIGLMYVHEHIRYAESLALTGKAEEFVKALRQAIPVDYRDVVPNGDIRQANCYYSSSDVHFKNRYEADERYEEVIEGKFTLRGGWRVYSSGPGIYIGLIVSKLLGLRIEAGNVILDPVLPFSMDGLEVSLDFMNYPLKIKYLVKEGNFCPKSIKVNGKDIVFDFEENKYRKGGAVIPVNMLERMLDTNDNSIEVLL